jgi:hypothetical protein
VAPEAAESGWREWLRIEVERAHRGVAECAEREMTWLRALAADGRLDVEEFGLRLRSLSNALAAETRRSVDAVIETVLCRVLVRPPDREVLDRVGVVLQRDVAERCCGSTTCIRALRVTGTAAAAIATAREAVASGGLLSDRTSGVLPPLSIDLTANCVPMLRGRAGTTSGSAPAGTSASTSASTSVSTSASGAGEREQAWVARAVDSLERELDRELSRQFTYLGQATSDLIADGLDHDLLLV